MEFTGFNPQGLDLLIENRMMNSPVFYEEHKPQIKTLVLEPFHALCQSMSEKMLLIDPLFVTTPSRMVSRVRRDTRYTKDKTLYRANLWLYFRRPRAQFEEVPFFYFELGPEYWRYGCWGGFGRGEMALARDMIIHEDKLFLDAYTAVQQIPDMQLRGEFYKRLKCLDAKEIYRAWSERKQLGVDFEETQNFAPVFDGSFVPQMLEHFQHLTPFYRFLWAIKERAQAGQGGQR
nr:DUF2461 family protein [uncultured Butyricicoccus sp.]